MYRLIALLAVLLPLLSSPLFAGDPLDVLQSKKIEPKSSKWEDSFLMPNEGTPAFLRDVVDLWKKQHPTTRVYTFRPV